MIADYEHKEIFSLHLEEEEIDNMIGIISTIIKYQSKTGYKKLVFKKPENKLIKDINNLLEQLRPPEDTDTKNE